MGGIEYSVVLPVYNEEGNINPLYAELTPVMHSLGNPYEIIFVDDGSTDHTFSVLRSLAQRDKRVRIVKFRRNFGQTAALDAGIKQSKGKILITLDADLQNDPKDIPRLLEKMKEGYDVVSGWRAKRKDAFSKKVFSKLANRLRRWLTGESIHDAGCTLKVYKRECFDNLTLYGEMHRYITTVLKYRGFKIGELSVNHRPRKFGKTKYNFKRIFKGFFDLLFIKFWNDFSTRPIHFFGTAATIQFVAAFAIFIEQVIKAFLIRALYVGPLLMLSVMLVITGFLTFFFGFLAEIMIRMYYRDKPNYEIEAVF
ncbi:MAG: glycosyltransferase family 2 protein [Candidatus Woesearchaeota archaeon]